MKKLEVVIIKHVGMNVLIVSDSDNGGSLF